MLGIVSGSFHICEMMAGKMIDFWYVCYLMNTFQLTICVLSIWAFRHTELSQGTILSCVSALRHLLLKYVQIYLRDFHKQTAVGPADHMLILSVISFSLLTVFASIGSTLIHVRFLALSLMFKEKKIHAHACLTVLSHSIPSTRFIFSFCFHSALNCFSVQSQPSKKRWISSVSFMFTCLPHCVLCVAVGIFHREAVGIV